MRSLTTPVRRQFSTAMALAHGSPTAVATAPFGISHDVTISAPSGSRVARAPVTKPASATLAPIPHEHTAQDASYVHVDMPVCVAFRGDQDQRRDHAIASPTANDIALAFQGTPWLAATNRQLHDANGAIPLAMDAYAAARNEDVPAPGSVESPSMVVFFGDASTHALDKGGLARALCIGEECLSFVLKNSGTPSYQSDRKFALYVDGTGLAPFPPRILPNRSGYTSDFSAVVRPQAINAVARGDAAGVIWQVGRSMLASVAGLKTPWLRDSVAEWMMHEMDPSSPYLYRIAARAFSRSWCSLAHDVAETPSAPPSSAALALVWTFVARRWSPGAALTAAQKVQGAVDAGRLDVHVMALIARALGVEPAAFLEMWLTDTLTQAYFREEKVALTQASAWYSRASAASGAFFIDPVRLTWTICTVAKEAAKASGLPGLRCKAFCFEVTDCDLAADADSGAVRVSPPPAKESAVMVYLANYSDGSSVALRDVPPVKSEGGAVLSRVSVAVGRV